MPPKDGSSPAALDQAVADECRELFGTVVGPRDSLWPLHIDVCREALAFGALTVDELSEWLAVARSRAGEPISRPLPPIRPSAEGFVCERDDQHRNRRATTRTRQRTGARGRTCSGR